MNLRLLWKHFVTSDLNLSKDDPRYRRVYLINTLSLLTISALLFYIFFNIFVSKLFLLAFIELIVLVIAFIPVFILRRIHNLELASTILILNLFSLLAFFIYTQNNNDYALAQAVFFPAVAIFLKGKRLGLIYSSIFIAFVLSLAYNGIGVWEPAPFTAISFTNLFTTYLFIMIMIYYFESSRHEAFTVIQEASQREYQNNLKLHEKTILLNHANEELREYKTNLEKKVEEMIEAKRAQDHILIQQSKMATMGEMISSIAHQWKQPLATTSAIVSNVMMDVALSYTRNDELVENMEQIEQQLKFMNQTINDFSNFFRPQKSKEKFNVSQTIINVIDLLESQLHNKGIHLQTDFEDETLSTDNYKSEFIQVLLNIIHNAKDALEDKMKQSDIDSEPARINIRTFSKGDHIHISIEDNAGGVPSSIIDEIFNPYFTTKAEGKGTGIGLYMSKTIIEESMGGRLNLTNGEHGAIFTIIL